VLGLDDDADALGLELVAEPVGHLLGEPLLHLEVSGEALDDPGQLGQAEDAAAREVADVGGAVEGQEVVLAQRVEGDVAGQHQLVVALVVGEGGEAERPGCEHLGVGGGDPPGRVGQVVVVVGVAAQGDQQVGDRLLGGGEVDQRAGAGGGEGTHHPCL
jgi:hypothetical protein